MGSPQPIDLGVWIMCLGGAVAACYYARSLWLSFFPVRSRAEEHVSRAELGEQLAALRLLIVEARLLISETRADLLALRSEIRGPSEVR